MPSPKTPAQTDGRGSAGGGKGGRKRRSRQQPGGTTTTPTTPVTPEFQSQDLASPDSRAADQVTEQQLLALKGQQEAAHELQLAEVAKKEKAAADTRRTPELQGKPQIGRIFANSARQQYGKSRTTS